MALDADMVYVKLPAGIHFLRKRGVPYAHLGDLIATLDAFEVSGREAGQDTYVLERFREALTSSYARAR